MELTKVGKRIREQRLLHKLTQVELAEKAGLSEMAIYSYETGKRLPALEPLVQLSKALETPVDSLLCDYVTAAEPSSMELAGKISRLPEKDRESIVKIVDALMSAAG